MSTDPHKDRMERETPLGFLRYAEMYHEAGDVLIRERRRISRLWVVMLSLFGRSIELSMKAYLRARGADVKMLKSSPLGHDLVALLKVAQEAGLDDIVVVSPARLNLIGILNDVYKEKRLEYPRTGFRVYPVVDDARACSKALLDAVTPLCRAQSHAFSAELH